MISTSKISKLFIQKYYTDLAYDPLQLEKLYGIDSCAQFITSNYNSGVNFGPTNIFSSLKEAGLFYAVTNLKNGSVNSIPHNSDGILILVNGTMIQSDVRHQFSQTFILRREDPNELVFYIQCDLLRFTQSVPSVEFGSQSTGSDGPTPSSMIQGDHSLPNPLLFDSQEGTVNSLNHSNHHSHSNSSNNNNVLSQKMGVLNSSGTGGKKKIGNGDGNSSVKNSNANIPVRASSPPSSSSSVTQLTNRLMKQTHESAKLKGKPASISTEDSHENDEWKVSGSKKKSSSTSIPNPSLNELKTQIVFVKGIREETTEDTIKEFFDRFGRIVEIRMFSSKMYCTVGFQGTTMSYKDHDIYDRILSELGKEFEFDGAMVHIEYFSLSRHRGLQESNAKNA